MRRNRLLAVLSCVAVIAAAAPSGATSIFISAETTPAGLTTQNETESIDISGGGTGLTLGIWALPVALQNLNGIDLNLVVVEGGGNAIDITGATVENPLITGAGGAKRWFDDGSISGAGIAAVAADLVTNLIGVTTTGTSAAGEGTGLDVANGANDPFFDSDTGAYLFATVTYDVINSGEGSAANLFLQIGSAGISDTTSGLVTSVIFGQSDPGLNAVNLVERGVSSLTADAEVMGGAGGPGITLLFGDANNDELVSGADFVATQGNFGATDLPADGLLLGDSNDDGIVSGADFVATQGAFGAFVPAASAAAVPEPTSFVLLCIGLALAGFFRRKI